MEHGMRDVLGRMKEEQAEETCWGYVGGPAQSPRGVRRGPLSSWSKSKPGLQGDDAGGVLAWSANGGGGAGKEDSIPVALPERNPVHSLLQREAGRAAPFPRAIP